MNKILEGIREAELKIFGSGVNVGKSDFFNGIQIREKIKKQ